MQESEEILQKNEFMIPVDKTIEEFMKHLWAHPRTILSASYGDGKSYFLKKFEEHNDMKGYFVFLKLYPVNYQVVENRDIFELIKYDLIFQLFISGMINPKEPISDKVLLPWFIMTQGESIASWVSKICGLIGVDYPEFNAAVLTMNALPTIVKWKKKWEKFKETNKEPDSEISSFIQKIDKHYLYEADAVSVFIREAIAEYKSKEENKRVVLVIEDMDRLDPAHLFRILNVLSAQVDYAYRYGVSPDRRTVAGNKFGVDNVLLVMDYENTKSIYQHFYGADTNFEGYINKFISHNVFYYSLTQEKYKYFSEYLNKEVKIRMELVHALLPDNVFDKKTIREIVAAMKDTEKQLFFLPSYVDINHNVQLPKEILQLMVVLRRLGKNDDEIAKQVESAIINHPFQMMFYLGGFWLQFRGKTISDSFFIKSGESGNMYHINIFEVLENGFARIEIKEIVLREHIKLANMREFAGYLMQYMAK